MHICSYSYDQLYNNLSLFFDMLFVFHINIEIFQNHPSFAAIYYTSYNFTVLGGVAYTGVEKTLSIVD